VDACPEGAIEIHIADGTFVQAIARIAPLVDLS
jgi:hypothetical protein